MKDYMEHDTSTMAIKASISWFGVLLANLGIERWSDVAAFLASVYTLALLFEWAYRRIKGHRSRLPPR